MLTNSKKTRRWALITALFLTLALIWWVQVYAPQKEKIQALDMKLAHLQVKAKKLESELARAEKHRESESDFARRSALAGRLLPRGQTPEEVNAEIQSALQSYFEEAGVMVRRYTEMSPGKWKDYPVARMEFQLVMDMQQLARLLEFLDKFGKTVRIESLRIIYQRGREAPLVVSLRLATLYLESDRRFQIGSMAILAWGYV